MHKELPNLILIILVRDLGVNIDTSQLQSAWEPEKLKQNKLHKMYLITLIN